MSRHLLLSYLLRAAHPGGEVPDAELLRRFAARRDEAAFELLVRRHADGVWRACRGVARQDADAEDAFQATFLALAKKPGAVRTGCVAGWLHWVAVHAALKARARSDRFGPPLPDDVPVPSADDGPDTAAVHEEVARLPDRYRLPVVLCDLEGHTHAEAAARLGWPVGTVSGRLSRARTRLRDRLQRRGVVTVALVTSAGSAPGSLVRTTVAVWAGRSPSAAVASLTNGVLVTMQTTKLKWAVTVAALALGLAGGGTLLAFGTADDPKPTAIPADPPKPAPPAALRPTAGYTPRPASPIDRASSRRSLVEVRDAIRAYYMDHGHLPADIRDKAGKPLLSWRVAILPYLNHRAVYQALKLDEPWDSPANRKLIHRTGVMPLTRSPGPIFDPRTGDAVTRIKRPTGPGTLNPPGEQALTLGPNWHRSDRLDQTILVVEAGDPVPWTKPADLDIDPKALTLPIGPFTTAILAATLTGNDLGVSLRPNLSPEQVRSLVTVKELSKIDEKPTPAEVEAFRGSLLATDGDGPEFKATRADLQFFAPQLARLRDLNAEVMAESVRQSHWATPEDLEARLAAELLKEGEAVTRLLGQLKDSLVYKDRPDLRKQLDEINREVSDYWMKQRNRGGAVPDPAAK